MSQFTKIVNANIFLEKGNENPFESKEYFSNRKNKGLDRIHLNDESSEHETNTSSLSTIIFKIEKPIILLIGITAIVYLLLFCSIFIKR